MSCHTIIQAVLLTNSVDWADRLLASVFFLPNVINFSASLCASFALCHVVEIVSCSKRDVTRLRRSALRWAESLLKCLYFTAPPAMFAGGPFSFVGAPCAL